MTTIRVDIDRLILHGPAEGLSPEVSRDLGGLVTARLQELAAGGRMDEHREALTETQRIADRVAGEVWRSVVQHREVRR